MGAKTQKTQVETIGSWSEWEYLVQGREQDRPMVAIGYARCSTEEQSIESMAIDYQVKRLEDVCGVGNVIRDEKSATKCLLTKRTKFWDAIDRLRDLPPGVERRLIYTRIDRLARNVQDGETIQQLCREGIVFQGLDSGEVMQGAQGTMMLNMGLLMAQYEQQLLGEKLEAKYRDRRQSKSPMNRPPFGYKLNKIVSETGIKFRFVPFEPQFTQAKQIYKAVIDNEGSLAGTLRSCDYEGMPRSARGLKMWLTNVANLGHTKYTGRVTRSGKTVPDEIIENTHKPVVDEETYNRVLALLGEKSTGSSARTERPPHPLQGVLRCPDCGFAVTFTSKQFKAKGNGIGRHAGKYKKGELRVLYSGSCRYRGQGRCNVDLSENCFSKPLIDSLKDQAWQALIDRADMLANLTSPKDNSISKEELELMAGIKALEAIPGDTMKPQIESMKAQLDQYKFKRDGKIRAANTKVAQVQAMNLSVRAFNQLEYGEQNELLRAFFHRIVPPYKGQPAIIDTIF